MYKFIMVKGGCGASYDLGKCESHANRMDQEGYKLVQVYQTSSAACLGQSKSVLVMVFVQK